MNHRKKILNTLVEYEEGMTQMEIFEETNMSKSLISETCSELEEEGSIVREYAGREKIVRLPNSGERNEEK